VEFIKKGKLILVLSKVFVHTFLDYLTFYRRKLYSLEIQQRKQLFYDAIKNAVLFWFQADSNFMQFAHAKEKDNLKILKTIHVGFS